MELMGYELEPDFAIVDGYYVLNDWLDTDHEANTMVGDEEQQRKNSSQAKPNVRFHYRLLATEHASKAADLLPRSSQAFAAVLCEASRWILVREPEYAKPLYQRYLREGSYVSWGKQFGQQCPAPDFQSAEKRAWAEHFNVLKHPSGKGILIYFCLLTLTVGLVWLFLKRKRRETPA